MKPQIIISKISFFLLLIVFLTSCSSIKRNDFTAQKYTDFKKGETPAAVNRVKVKASEHNFIVNPIVAENSDVEAYASTELFTLPQTQLPEVKEPIESIKSYANPINSKKLSRKIRTDFVINRFINKPNTASENNSSDVELLLLVILALILPPLAVLLARGVGSEFLLSIILTILFWVPGQIYALLVVFDVI